MLLDTLLAAALVALTFGAGWLRGRRSVMVSIGRMVNRALGRAPEATVVLVAIPYDAKAGKR